MREVLFCPYLCPPSCSCSNLSFQSYDLCSCLAVVFLVRTSQGTAVIPRSELLTQVRTFNLLVSLHKLMKVFLDPRSSTTTLLIICTPFFFLLLSKYFFIEVSLIFHLIAFILFCLFSFPFSHFPFPFSLQYPLFMSDLRRAFEGK